MTDGSDVEYRQHDEQSKTDFEKFVDFDNDFSPFLMIQWEVGGWLEVRVRGEGKWKVGFQWEVVR